MRGGDHGILPGNQDMRRGGAGSRLRRAPLRALGQWEVEESGAKWREVQLKTVVQETLREEKDYAGLDDEESDVPKERRTRGGDNSDIERSPQ